LGLQRQALTAAALPPITLSLTGLAIVCSFWYGNGDPVAFFLIEHRAAIQDGELWRLLTSAPVHADALHLAINLFWLWLFGRPVENRLGALRYAAFVMLTAGGSATVEFLSGTVGLGLSGTIYGVFGFLFALRAREEFAARLMTPLVVALLAGWFLACIAATHAGLYAVGNVAHGTGLAMGWFIGLLLRAAPLPGARYQLTRMNSMSSNQAAPLLSGSTAVNRRKRTVVAPVGAV
jgi:membrane associated rhomboid family serine protease